MEKMVGDFYVDVGMWSGAKKNRPMSVFRKAGFADRKAKGVHVFLPVLLFTRFVRPPVLLTSTAFSKKREALHGAGQRITAFRDGS